VNEHRGVLLVTHDARLLQFADRVIEIDDGRIVRDESIRSLPAVRAVPTQ